MLYKSKDMEGGGGSSSLHGKSYISKRPTRKKSTEKESRKTSVTDSLAKFLDDCGDEDLLIATANVSPSAKSRASLSMSEHGPRSPGVLSPPLKKPVRRGTKKGHLQQQNQAAPIRRRSFEEDEEFMAITKFHNSLGSGLMSPNPLSMSEHGTPATQKASLDSNKTAQALASLINKLDTDDDPSISSVDASFAGDEVADKKRSKKKPSKKKSKSSKTPPSKSSRKERTAEGSSSTSSPRERGVQRSRSSSGRSRVERSASDRSGRKREKSRGTRRTKSDGPLSLNDHFGSSRSRSSGAMGRRRQDDEERSVASTRSTRSTMSTMSTRSRSLGLDAGPLNAFLNADPQQRRRNGSSHSVGPGLPPTGPPSDSFMRRRKSRQDEILQQAQQERWRARKEEARRRRRTLHGAGDDSDYVDEDSSAFMEGIAKGEDNDQPKVKGKPKKGALARLKEGITKTGKVTKSTAKGTVNVVRDPKRAAKKVGGFAKDVGKGTVQMALDPKLAAKTAANLGKDITKGTYKVTKGVGKGVAKGSLGVTKAVAKTGVNATTMVVGTALDGAGHLVHGATSIFKHGNSANEEDHSTYNASELQSRRRSLSLLERVNSVYDGSSKPAAKPESSEFKTSLPRASGVVAPTLMINKDQGWDF